jgi:hypothetical protein
MSGLARPTPMINSGTATPATKQSRRAIPIAVNSWRFSSGRIFRGGMANLATADRSRDLERRLMTRSGSGAQIAAAGVKGCSGGGNRIDSVSGNHT